MSDDKAMQLMARLIDVTERLGRAKKEIRQFREGRQALTDLLSHDRDLFVPDLISGNAYEALCTLERRMRVFS